MKGQMVQGLKRFEPEYLYVKNISGGALAVGDAVMFSVTGETGHDAEARTVLKATVAGENRFAGIVVGLNLSGGSIPDDGFGYIVVRGLCRSVKVGTVAVTAGASLFVGPTDGTLGVVGETGEGVIKVGVALAADVADVVPEAIIGF